MCVWVYVKGRKTPRPSQHEWQPLREMAEASVDDATWSLPVPSAPFPSMASSREIIPTSHGVPRTFAPRPASLLPCQEVVRHVGRACTESESTRPEQATASCSWCSDSFITSFLQSRVISISSLSAFDRVLLLEPSYIHDRRSMSVWVKEWVR